MGAAAVIGVGIQAYGTYQGLRASSVAAKYNAQIDRSNIKIKEMRIEDLRSLGARAARQLETEAVHFVGEQVTAFASGGIDISSAVVSEAIEETARTSAADIIELQHNIERDIWGLEVGIMSDQASELLNRLQAKSAARLAPIAAVGTAVSAASPFLFRGTPPVNPLERTTPRIR
jgi:hypothetical protein